MAKYTELLSEYINNGGTLPAVFSQIEGFEDLFLANYIDSEIGFETENLFQIKLELTANLYVPKYAARIAKVKELEEQLLNPTKTRVRRGNIERTKAGEISRITGATDETRTNTKEGNIVNTVEGETKNTPGAQTVIQSDFPFDTSADFSDPSTKSQTTYGEGVTNNSNTDTESYNDYKETEHTEGQARTDTESYNGYEEKENYNDITDTETGFTPSELIAIRQLYTDEVNNILMELLNKFSNCFMVIY